MKILQQILYKNKILKQVYLNPDKKNKKEQHRRIS